MAKKTSTVASSCAPFCTEQDVEWIKSSPAFSLARRVRSAFGNDGGLFILPPRPYDHANEGRLFLGNELGFPVLYVRDGYEGAVGDTLDYCVATPSNLHVESSNRSYVLTRAKLKAKNQVSEWKLVNMADKYRRLSYDLMTQWLRAATASQEIEAGKTIVLTPKAQEYLIRMHCGSVTQNLLPPAVQKEIEAAHDELVRTAAFTASAHDHAVTMFGREKWLLWDMGSYVIVAGIETSSLCQVAQEIMSKKISISSAFYSEYEKNIKLQFTHEPRAYRSLDAMPDEVRGSLVSSLAFVKTMLAQDSRITPTAQQYPGLLGLPFYYANTTNSRIVNVDGGWIFKCGNSGHSKPFYGQMLLMDKD